ncbi:MAG: hypothetical protein KatS3mg111_1353 [Pirellulaceae bacterium]|nr:MAG: hypothetical protein KatS3mg111_1353 [Pirellulaceae bacterium]
MNQAEETASVGFCARCGSENLEPLPPNSFSRKPGYLCMTCGTKHRGRKSTWMYAGILLLGLLLAAGGIAAFMSEDGNDGRVRRRSPLRLVVLGVVVAGWAAWQFRVPPVADHQPSEASQDANPEP